MENKSAGKSKREKDLKDVNESHNLKKEDNESSDDESLFSDNSFQNKSNDENDYQKSIAEMSENDFKRYEVFRCSNFPKAGIKKLISNIIGQAVNPNIVIGVAGLCKVFMGEMIGEAKNVQKENQQTGPLLPSHIHEAYRRLYKKIPNMKVFKKAPWN